MFAREHTKPEIDTMLASIAREIAASVTARSNRMESLQWSAA
jgi:hypothetical protein